MRSNNLSDYDVNIHDKITKFSEDEDKDDESVLQMFNIYENTGNKDDGVLKITKPCQLIDPKETELMKSYRHISKND